MKIFLVDACLTCGKTLVNILTEISNLAISTEKVNKSIFRVEQSQIKKNTKFF